MGCYWSQTYWEQRWDAGRSSFTLTLLVQVLGERGIHWRSAVSGAQVPFGACVEIDMIAEIEARTLTEGE